MKNTLKILGAALALCAVSAFAASALPNAEYTEKAAEETQDTITETAQAFADDDIIASWEFDAADTATRFESTERSGYAAGTVEWDFNTEELAGETIKYVSVTPKAAESVTDGLCPNVYFKPSADANSYYGFTGADLSAIDRIEMRVRLAQANQYAAALPDYTTVQIQGSYRLLANKTITKEQADEWVTLSVTPEEFLNTPANNALNSLRFYIAPGLYEGWTLDIDYIRVYKKTSAEVYTASVYVDGQELSDATNSVCFDSGIFTFTFDKAPGVAAEKFTTDVLGDTAGNFSADGTVMSGDGVTYTVYARRDLRGKTVTFADKTTSEYEYKLGMTAAFASAGKEGRNVFVNGNFENPYLNKWQVWGAGSYTSAITDGGMKVTFGASNGNFSLFAYNHGGTAAFEKGAKYLLSISVTFPSADQPSALGANTVDLYPYLLTTSDVRFRANSGNYFDKWSDPAKYPTLNENLNANSIILNYTGRNDTVQSVSRIFDTSDDAVTEALCKTPYIFFAPYSSSAKISELEGLNYVINGVSAKKLFTVSFDPDGGVGTEPQNALYAFDENFYFPENTFAKENAEFAGWEYNGKVYQPGETVVPYVTGDGALTLKALWNEKNRAPVMQDNKDVKTDYTGIRFYANVYDGRNDEKTEYGFLVTTEIIKDKLTAAGKNTELSFEKAAIANLYKKGVAHDKNTNIVFRRGEEYDVIAAMVTGIPTDMKDKKVYIRSYITYDGGETYIYGEEKSASINDVLGE